MIPFERSRRVRFYRINALCCGTAAEIAVFESAKLQSKTFTKWTRGLGVLSRLSYRSHD